LHFAFETKQKNDAKDAGRKTTLSQRLRWQIQQSQLPRTIENASQDNWTTAYQAQWLLANIFIFFFFLSHILLLIFKAQITLVCFKY